MALIRGWLVLVLCVVWLQSAPVTARDIYVNNRAGNDLFDGTAPRPAGDFIGPVRTIQRALLIARKGDRVVIENTGEPYRESVVLEGGRNSGSEVSPFILEGNGAVLDGSAAIPEEAWEHVRGHVYRYQPPLFHYQQLFLDGLPAQRRTDIEAEHQVIDLEPLEWCYVERFLYFRTEDDRSPHEYDLSHTRLSVGVGLYEVRNVIVRDLIVQGYRLDGIDARDSVFHSEVAGITARGNGRSGISVGGASRLTVQNCLVGNNAVAQVRTEGRSWTRLVECDLVDDMAPAIVHEGGRIEVDEITRRSFAAPEP